MQIEDGDLLATEFRLRYQGSAVAFRPGKDGLNVKALTYSLFIVRRNALGGRSLNVIDPECTPHRYLGGHRAIAGMAALHFVVVAGTAVGANVDIPCSKFSSVARPNFRRQLRLHNPVCAALVVNQATRTEF